MRPTRRIELLPVVVVSAMLTANRDPANPFDNGRNFSRRVGADLKMGLGPNLTLDATVNPDFGQVDADPAEVNLTAFETRFPERRPFFTEGSRLLNLEQHPNVFYTRRIGRAPDGRASGDFVDYPKTSTILGAAKITGRLSGGTSLGVLAAVTNEEFARVAYLASSEIERVRVGPRTAFGVAKVQQEFGDMGSTASVLLGTVHRALDDGDPLAALLSQNALVYGSDALLRFRRGEYELAMAVVGSYVEGEPVAIERIQRSSSHYMQRPDRDYGRIDPTRTSLSGVSFRTYFNRTGGEHWLFGFLTQMDSQQFETNDIARLVAADGIQPSANVTYRETRPGRIFRNYSIRLNQANEWNWGWDRQKGSLGMSTDVTWANFWSTSLSVTRTFRRKDAALARGGPLVGGPREWQGSLRLGNRSSSQTRWLGRIAVTEDELGGGSLSVDGTFSFRPDPRWEGSLTPSYIRRTEPQQYVTALEGGRPETYATRYVFAYVDRSTWSTQLRAAFTFRPDLNLDIYAEPFVASGRYYDYGELLEPGSMERLTYGSSGTTVELEPDGSRVVTAGDSKFVLRNDDFNVLSFRSNVVLRWEWRPGTTMYLVWQQNRERREAIGTRVGLADLWGSLTEPGTNILLFKTSFWIPVR